VGPLETKWPSKSIKNCVFGVPEFLWNSVHSDFVGPFAFAHHENTYKTYFIANEYITQNALKSFMTYGQKDSSQAKERRRFPDIARWLAYASNPIGFALACNKKTGGIGLLALSINQEQAAKLKEELNSIKNTYFRPTDLFTQYKGTLQFCGAGFTALEELMIVYAKISIIADNLGIEINKVNDDFISVEKAEHFQKFYKEHPDAGQLLNRNKRVRLGLVAQQPLSDFLKIVDKFHPGYLGTELPLIEAEFQGDNNYLRFSERAQEFLFAVDPQTPTWQCERGALNVRGSWPLDRLIADGKIVVIGKDLAFDYENLEIFQSMQKGKLYK